MTKKFSLRTTAPSTTNAYYLEKGWNSGVNECIVISNHSCLPNCVGFCWGNWYEMMKVRPNLSRRNAKEWYGYTADGYRRSQTPALGAVACWGGGKYGHVGIVVGIHSDHITVAQSNYGGNRFEVVNCYKMSDGGYKSHGGNTSFQGFILLPSEYEYEGNTSNNTGKSTNGTHTYKKFNATRIYGSKPKTFTVKTSGLRLRAYPKTGSVKKLMNKGTKLLYYGNGYYVDGKEVWYCVQIKKTSTEGYVYGGILNSGNAPYLNNANP